MDIKERFLNNVFYLAKQKGYAISSIENMIDVSVGYLSKLKNDETRKNIAADIMFAISDALEVSVDTLCKSDFEKLNYDEISLIKFFEKFKVDTLNNKCKWEQESSSSILLGHGHIGESELVRCNVGYHYYSQFREGVPVVVSGNSYVLKIKYNVYLALVRVKLPNKSAMDDLEVYILDGEKANKAKKLCATGNDNVKELDVVVEELYKVAENSGKRLALESDTSKFIEEYLGESDEYHYDNLPS